MTVSVVNLGTDPADTQVRVTVRDPRGRVVAAEHTAFRSVAPGSTVDSPLDLSVEHARLWSIEHPNLYTARAEVVADGRVVDSVTTSWACW